MRALLGSCSLALVGCLSPADPAKAPQSRDQDEAAPVREGELDGASEQPVPAADLWRGERPDRIAGRLIDVEGEPLAGIWIGARAQDLYPRPGRLSAHTETSATGEFAFTGLAQGEYTLSMLAPGAPVALTVRNVSTDSLELVFGIVEPMPADPLQYHSHANPLSGAVAQVELDENGRVPADFDPRSASLSFEWTADEPGRGQFLELEIEDLASGIGGPYLGELQRNGLVQRDLLPGDYRCSWRLRGDWHVGMTYVAGDAEARVSVGAEEQARVPVQLEVGGLIRLDLGSEAKAARTSSTGTIEGWARLRPQGQADWIQTPITVAGRELFVGRVHPPGLWELEWHPPLGEEPIVEVLEVRPRETAVFEVDLPGPR
ncbi:carboxypeptidase-like regulatory domain-containing protein [Engelhardtia mirabilis]|uniref:carboxypeptidase-like regulatory domain-containing protein n=1 Tax=Engelhardtia mirabilis TaxID=2528011 RepID=UPI0011A3ABC3